MYSLRPVHFVHKSKNMVLAIYKIYILFSISKLKPYHILLPYLKFNLSWLLNVDKFLWQIEWNLRVKLIGQSEYFVLKQMGELCFAADWFDNEK